VAGRRRRFQGFLISRPMGWSRTHTDRDFEHEWEHLGGFPPAAWESRVSYRYNKADDSLKSFLFTLKNPHNVAARRFALMADMNHRAIDCSCGCGPWFGVDISVSDHCNTNTGSMLSLASLTQITPDGTGTSFLRVRGVSKSTKSKSSQSQTK
jgi:hypothetical protein